MNLASASSYTGTVHVHDGIIADEKHTQCKIFVLGDTAKLTKWNPVSRRFEQIDTLLEFDITESDGAITITGKSSEMMDEVGLPAAEAMVRWSMDLVGCQDCQ